MKQIIMSLLLAACLFPALAQTTDSTATPHMKSDSSVNAPTNTNTMQSDSSRNNSTNLKMSNNNMNSNMSSGTNNNLNPTDSNSTRSTMNNGNGSGNYMITNTANTPGQKGYASLPVLENWISDDMLAKIKTKYGTQVYDITSIKHTADQNAYLVRFGDNGVYKSEMMSEDGSVIQ